MTFVEPHNSELAGLPRFRHLGVILDYDGLRYNPSDDIIFPSIVRTSPWLPTGSPRYFMYYAPHDAPGGICLATADRLAGPWREYDANPVIGRTWAPHYDVSHVSSPHAVWNDDEGLLFLYFHGDNDVTRLATSKDGIHFDYAGPVVTIADFDGTSESSYARIFRYDLPGTDARWIMLLMGNCGGNRPIFFASSRDGRTWTTKREPLILPPPGYADVGSPWHFPWQGKHYILLHAHEDGENRPFSSIHAYEVDAAFTETRRLGLFYDRSSVSPENERHSDVFTIEEDGTLYLVTDIGMRLHQKIALAVEDGTW
ncbi:MAG: hypothetical protein P4L33_13965 [Capsulimonadaceae bacterium]|nr:hypothetical protein [Capsulimonadaceae bacterium]